MAKIAFVQTILTPILSMYYLCGALKHFSHEYKIIASNHFDHIIGQLKQFQPDLLGFSMYSGYHSQCIEIIQAIKTRVDVPVIVGGPHPTFFPDIIKSDSVDIVCRGEGELALVELLDRIDAEQSYDDVQNLTIKMPNGEHISNDVRDLIDPLDSLPFPDFGIYGQYPVIMDQIVPISSTVRGCPYSCTYCYNVGYRRLYKTKGRYVRAFSPKRIVAELKDFLKYVPHAKIVHFPGDCFGISDDWLEELMIFYRKEIGLPFSCLYRPEIITDRKARFLSEGGCLFVAFGIESGSEKIRKEILKRNYSNQDIIRAADTLKKYGIKYRAYNMIGLPGENIDDLWETVKLNREIKPELPWCSFYTPYPGTELAEQCIQLNLVPQGYNIDMLPTNFHLGSILRLPNKNHVVNVHHFFQSMILFPKLEPLWKALVNQRQQKLFELWFKAIYLYYRIKFDRPRNILSYIISMIRSRK